MGIEIKLPQLAEGVDKGDVISVNVKVGDEVAEDAPLLELESEKATISVPSPQKGKISKILVKAGDKIKVGQVIVEMEGGNSASAPAAETPPAAAVPPPGPAAPTKAPKASTPELKPVAATVRVGEMVPAGPAVRRIARELGIDLLSVRGSGRNGRITVDDLDAHIQGYIARKGGGGFAAPPVELPDFSKWGPVRREKADNLRKKIAEKMTQSWSTIPHVHQFHEADLTDLLALQKRQKDRVKAAGGALTITIFALKAAAIALREFPQFNASYDPLSQEIIYKEYYNIGIAVDTEAGLLVPVVRDVDKKPVIVLAKELAELSQKTRDRKTSIEDLRGGTFTISNLGGIGGSHFTPIINAPEVAILGIGRSSKKVVVAADGSFVARDIAPLCLGYDHRIIDGAVGARFIVRIAEILENFEATFLGF